MIIWKKIVVNIPEDLPLTEAEKSVRRKALTFELVKNKVDEYQANNETCSEPSDESDPFAKLDVKICNWTPPDGQFSAADHYIERCCRFFNSLTYMPVCQSVRTRASI